MGASRLRYLTSHGWLQDQHGAWPMALLPIILGSLIGGWTLAHTALFVAWFAGFHVFNAATLWAKARSRVSRRRQYEKALLTWLAVAGFFGVIVLVSVPAVLWWVPFFVPLIAGAGWEAWQKNERALLARVTTILASTLMLPLAVWLSEAAADPSPFEGFGSWSAFADSLSLTSSYEAGYRVWPMAILLGAYFLATVPYVRCLIRGRRDRRWFVGSVLFHLLIAVTVTILWAGGWAEAALTTLPMVALWWVLTARAYLVPVAQQRGARVRPGHIGAGEFVLTAVLVAVLLG